MMFSCVAIFAIIAFVLGVDAHHHRHHHHNNNNNARRPEDGFYSWIRDIGNNRQVEENAFIRPGGNLLYAESSDDALRFVNAQPSRSFYDFSTPIPIAVLAPFGGPCYYSNTTLDLNNTVTKLGGISNTVIPAGDAVALDGTAVRLTPEEVARLNGAYPALDNICNGRDIVPIFPVGAIPSGAQNLTEVLKIFTLDSVVMVTVPRRRPDIGRFNGGGRSGSSSSSEDRDRHRGHGRGHGGRGHNGRGYRGRG
jgi:hypothetical protein